MMQHLKFQHEQRRINAQIEALARRLSDGRTSPDQIKAIGADIRRHIQESKNLLDQLKHSIETAVRSQSLGRNRLRLVWLDDDIDTFRPILDELKFRGIDILPVKSPEEFQNIVNDSRDIDGYIFDLFLEEEDGGSAKDSISLIESTKRKKPFIVCSAFLSHGEMQRRLIELGAVGFLEKRMQMSNDIEHVADFFADRIDSFFERERQRRRIVNALSDRKEEVLSTLEFALSEVEQLPSELQESIKGALKEVQAEVSKPKPNVDKINRKLQSVRNVSEGAAGSLAASGILHLISILF